MSVLTESRIDMEEIWKPIEGYEGLYEVSNLGRVKSLVFRNNASVFRRDKVLKQKVDKLGYCRVTLCVHGVRKDFTVHRLVALAFIDNDDPVKKKYVNHIDYNPSNNRVDNLEWVTPQMNCWHSDRNERIGQGRRGIKSNTGLRHIYRGYNGRYLVYVKHHGSSRYGGTFVDIDDAFNARTAIWKECGIQSEEVEEHFNG